MRTAPESRPAESQRPDPFDLLAGAAVALTEATDIPSAASAIVEHAVRSLGAAGAFLVLVSADGTTLEVVGATGIPAENLHAWSRFPADSQTPLAEAIRAAEPRWPESMAERTARYPHLAQQYRASGEGAWLSLPLLTRGRPVGGLSIRLPEHATLNEDARRLALALAALAATAIERARLQEAERRAADTARFLADAGALLAGSLDYEQTLAAVARAAVPQVADWCAADLLDERGDVQRLAAHHVDPAKIALAYDLQRRYPPADAPGTIRYTLRTGQPQLFEFVPDSVLAQSARDPEHLGLLRSLGLTSYAIVPMRDGSRILGALTLCMAESGRRLTRADLAVTEQLADRAALAIRHARIYREAQQRADDLARLGTALRQTAEARDAALAEANAERQRLTALFHSSPAMIAVTRGPTHTVELANPAFLGAVGIRNVVGMPIRQALPELADQRFFERLDAAFASGAPHTDRELAVRIDRNGDGRFTPDEHIVLNLAVHPFGDSRAAVAGLMIHAIDVSDHFRARANALAARDELERVLNRLNDHYVVYDRDWRYVFVNDAATEVLGLPKHELLGRRIWDLFPDAVGNGYYRALHQALEEQRDLVFEFHYPPFGKWFENHVYASPDGVSVLSTDISARKRAEANTAS